jgi:DNA-binding NarL/FixJ family response regulator
VKEPIRVLLCDDQSVIRTRVREALADTPDIQVVGEAAGGVAAVQLALELTPNLVLMDVVMPGLSGIEATRQIRAAAPDIRVLAFSAGAEQQTVDEMFAAGALGFIVKDGDSEELVRAIRSVAAGMYYLSPGFRGDRTPPRPVNIMPDANQPFRSEPPLWVVQYVPERKIVIATAAGPITDANAKGQAQAVIASLTENEANLLLFDYSEALSEMSFAILYWMPRFHSALDARQQTRMAVVLPRTPDNLETFQLYALACEKAGHSVKLFRSRTAAEAWLQEQSRA